MQGYNGSQLWDTTFAVQAICATGLATEFAGCLRKAQHYVDVTQASVPSYTTVPAGRMTPWQWWADSAKLPKKVRRLHFWLEAGEGRLPGAAGSLVPAHQQGRLALLHAGPRLAYL